MKVLLLLISAILFNFSAKASDRLIDIQELETRSGINIWLVEDHSVPVISLKFAFKGAGSLNEHDNNQGLVQLLSNTMDEGAGDYSSQEFQKELTDHSISLSFSGGRDSFNGSLKTLTEYKEKSFELLRLALTEPRFDEEPVERMKQANISRIKNSMTDPNWIAARIMNDVAFSGHPYARNSGGTLSTLPNIATKSLHDFVEQELTRDRLIIAISGNITPEETLKTVEYLFGSMKNVERDTTDHKLYVQNKGTISLFNHNVPQSSIKITLPGIRHGDSGYFAAKIMNHIYGASGFGSRLMKSIREEAGLTYGIYSSLSEMDWTETLNISTSTKNETVIQALEMIEKEADSLKEITVSEEELQDAKNYIIGSMPLSLTSTSALTSIMMSLQSQNLPSTYLDTIDDNINNVTIADVQLVARQLLDFNNAVIVLVGKPDNVVPTKTITKLPNVE